MTNRALTTIITLSDISKAKVLIPEKAVYLKKPVRKRMYYGSKKFIYDEEEFIILLDNGKRVGGIYIMGDWDLHIIVFNKYKGQHHMSNFMRSGWIKKLFPDLNSITCIHYNDTDEFKVVKHLADLADLEIREEKERMLIV